MTFYTHKNKSASVFLGTNPGASKDSSNQLESKAKGGEWFFCCWLLSALVSCRDVENDQVKPDKILEDNKIGFYC